MKEDILLANEALNNWCGTKDIKYYESLDSCFKYAVPKVSGRNHLRLEIGSKATMCYIVPYGEDFSIAKSMDKDPAPALFWAIRKLIKSNQNSIK